MDLAMPSFPPSSINKWVGVLSSLTAEGRRAKSSIGGSPLIAPLITEIGFVSLIQRIL